MTKTYIQPISMSDIPNVDSLGTILLFDMGVVLGVAAPWSHCDLTGGAFSVWTREIGRVTFYPVIDRDTAECLIVPDYGVRDIDGDRIRMVTLTPFPKQVSA